MNKKQLVRAVELLEVPDDAIQVDVWTNDGSDLKKTSFYTKSDEALDAETKEEVKEDPKPNSSGLVTKKVELNGQTVDVDNIAPFARAFYAKAEGEKTFLKWNILRPNPVMVNLSVSKLITITYESFSI